MINVETYKVIIAQFHKMCATTRNSGGLSAYICMNTDGILFSEVRPYIEELSELGFFDTIVKPQTSTKYIMREEFRDSVTYEDIKCARDNNVTLSTLMRSRKVKKLMKRINISK